MNANDLTSEQIEIAGKILVAGVKLGYAYLKAGIIKFEHWNKAMHNDLALPLATSMHLSNAEIDEFIGDMWKSKFPVDGEVHTLEEWSSILDKEIVKNKKTYNSMKTIKDAVYDAFMIQGVNYQEMSIDDIALEIQDKDSDYKEYDLDELRKKVSSYMSNAITKIVKGKRVENKDSLYERVKNGKGGFKKGIYRLRKPKVKKEPKKPAPILQPIEQPVSIESLYMGSAGEMAVCSELLFREYNVSRMSVDDGIDIVAMKHNKTYYIQVKTVQVKSENFGVQIKTKSYERYNANDCYYIIVARAETTQFIIATADDIRRLIERGITKGDKYISLRFNQNMGSLFVGEENVDYMLNSFERIK